MNEVNAAFLLAAMGVGALHTVLAPNHYLPFAIIAKVRNWSYIKTMGVTLLCGGAHIISSLALGLAGVALGVALSGLELFDGHRASVAAAMLIIFGLVYLVWGIRHAVLDRGHHHHSGPPPSSKKTVMALFAVFLVMPCEVWLPFLMVPAVEKNYLMVTLLALAFSFTTVICMLAMVSLTYYGAGFLPAKRMERYGDAVAGAVILLCGLFLQFGEVFLEHHH